MEIAESVKKILQEVRRFNKWPIVGAEPVVWAYHGGFCGEKLRR